MKTAVIFLVSFFFAFMGSVAVAQNNSNFEAFKKAQQAEFDAFKNQKNSEFEAFKKAKEKEFNDFAISSKTQPEHEPFLRDVPCKELKASIKGYSEIPGGIPLDLFLKKDSDNYLFKITKPVLAQTYLAGDFAIFNQLKNEGIDMMNKTFTFEFEKKVGKNVSMIKVIAIKK